MVELPDNNKLPIGKLSGIFNDQQIPINIIVLWRHWRKSKCRQQ